MTDKSDPFWDELGIAWQTVEVQGGATAAQLSLRLRRQTLLITGAICLAVAFGCAALMLGAATVWLGWTGGAWHFVSRGVALVALAAILWLAAKTLWSIRSGDHVRALPEMIALSVARAKRWLMVVRLGLSACVLVAVFGLAGTVIRTRQSGPPALSPVVDLLILAGCAVGLWLYGRHLVGVLARFEYLERALGDRER